MSGFEDAFGDVPYPYILTSLYPHILTSSHPTLAGCRHTTRSRNVGSSRLRSPASLVTTSCWALRAHTTTCASTMSLVRVAASNRPMVVASGPSSGTRSVLGCRMSRARRAWLAGRRMACANAVAGIVTRRRRSAARARSASTRRSFLSSAMRPPASNVMPLTRLSCGECGPCGAAKTGAHRPTRAPFS